MSNTVSTSFRLDFDAHPQWAMHIRGTPQLLDELRKAHNDGAPSTWKFAKTGNDHVIRAGSREFQFDCREVDHSALYKFDRDWGTGCATEVGIIALKGNTKRSLDEHETKRLQQIAKVPERSQPGVKAACSPAQLGPQAAQRVAAAAPQSRDAAAASSLTKRIATAARGPEAPGAATSAAGLAHTHVELCAVPSLGRTFSIKEEARQQPAQQRAGPQADAIAAAGQDASRSRGARFTASPSLSPAESPAQAASRPSQEGGPAAEAEKSAHWELARTAARRGMARQCVMAILCAKVVARKGVVLQHLMSLFKEERQKMPQKDTVMQIIDSVSEHAHNHLKLTPKNRHDYFSNVVPMLSASGHEAAPDSRAATAPMARPAQAPVVNPLKRVRPDATAGKPALAKRPASRSVSPLPDGIAAGKKPPPAPAQPMPHAADSLHKGAASRPSASRPSLPIVKARDSHVSAGSPALTAAERPDAERAKPHKKSREKSKKEKKGKDKLKKHRRPASSQPPSPAPNSPAPASGLPVQAPGRSSGSALPKPSPPAKPSSIPPPKPTIAVTKQRQDGKAGYDDDDDFDGSEHVIPVPSPRPVQALPAANYAEGGNVAWPFADAPIHSPSANPLAATVFQRGPHQDRQAHCGTETTPNAADSESLDMFDTMRRIADPAAPQDINPSAMLPPAPQSASYAQRAAEPFYGEQAPTSTPEQQDESWFSSYLEPCDPLPEIASAADASAQVQRFEHDMVVYQQLRQALHRGSGELLALHAQVCAAESTAADDGGQALWNAKVAFELEFRRRYDYLDRCSRALSNLHGGLAAMQACLMQHLQSSEIATALK